MKPRIPGWRCSPSWTRKRKNRPPRQTADLRCPRSRMAVPRGVAWRYPAVCYGKPAGSAKLSPSLIPRSAKAPFFISNA